MGRFEITRRIPAWGWLIIGVAGLVLTGITFFIEVQIVLIKPDLGNVSGTVAEHTVFKDWESMLSAAGKEWVVRQISI